MKLFALWNKQHQKVSNESDCNIEFPAILTQDGFLGQIFARINSPVLFTHFCRLHSWESGGLVSCSHQFSSLVAWPSTLMHCTALSWVPPPQEAEHWKSFWMTKHKFQAQRLHWLGISTMPCVLTMPWGFGRALQANYWLSRHSRGNTAKPCSSGLGSY